MKMGKDYVSSMRYSILVNGEVVSCFKRRKGLRQGDPVSPVLFTLIMELLSSLLHDGKKEKRFLPHPRSSKIGLSHLCFVDDVLLFFRGEFESLGGAMEILEMFSSYIGLHMNI